LETIGTCILQAAVHFMSPSHALALKVTQNIDPPSSEITP